MADLIVQVVQLDEVKPHAGAERLDLATIGGYQCVLPRGRYKKGDKVVYVPIDSLLPDALSERLGVKNYLGGAAKNRVRCAKLRGEPSFGLVFDPDDPTWEVGRDVKDHYGITKYEPPIKATTTDAEADHPTFLKFSDPSNLRQMMTVFEPGEAVIATEKIHGTSVRIGVADGEWMAGSKELRRKRPDSDAAMATNWYWLPYSLPQVRTLVGELSKTAKQVILYGETYGRVQSLKYGKPNTLGFVAFDLMIDGHYLDPTDFVNICDFYGVPTAPVVYSGPFDIKLLAEKANERSVLAAANGDPKQVMEGVVVRPVKERTHPKTGRVILKFLSDNYLFSKHVDEDQKDV